MTASAEITISDIRGLGTIVGAMRWSLKRRLGDRLLLEYENIAARISASEDGSTSLTPSEAHLLAALRANDVDAVTKHLIDPPTT